jgi:glutathione-regulated potassium-efflux system ancillary protein KefF
MILLLHAHPYPSRSRACRTLRTAASGVPGVTVHDLYDRYPDFDIAVPEEQARLRAASLIIALHPVYWYAMPGLLKQWMDCVLVRGFAYGPGGTALQGKHFLWVPTTGGDAEAYTPAGMHARPFSDFLPPVEQAMRYCGMQWLSPHIVHGAHLIGDDTLASQAATLVARIEDWKAQHAG